MPVKRWRILVVHGPNLNLLGKREPEVYGKQTLANINRALKKMAAELDVKLDCFQSNFEGEIVDKIQRADCDGILINPAALTHTSIALRDVLLAKAKAVIEVHISNIFSREEFRKHSYISDIAVGVITGLGAEGYLMGFKALAERLK